jgi:Cu(I)/Ag(I) efflux system membrane fusion protein
MSSAAKTWSAIVATIACGAVAAAQAIEPHAGHDHGTATPPGYAPVTIDASRAATLQLTTAPVDEREFTRNVRTVGTVVVDETRTAHVHVKVRGWIDGIFVNFVGKKVAPGEPLCAIYSQDVYSAEIEFLSVLGRAGTRPQPDPLLAAARQRLALWDVPKREVERLEQTREANRTFPLLAPRAGTVVAKEALQGMYVDPSVELYMLSDLSRVWVLADVYETDVPYVRLGDKAQLAIEGREAPLTATISFLYPTIDEASRTRKVRFALENPNGRLLPGAFVTVTMQVPLGTGLSVPESAVIRTGTRSIVFVAHGAGAEGLHFEPREITLGPLVGDRYRVDSGLHTGEEVATGAQFLLDSESRLRATSGPGGGHVHSH